MLNSIRRASGALSAIPPPGDTSFVFEPETGAPRAFNDDSFLSEVVEAMRMEAVAAHPAR